MIKGNLTLDLYEQPPTHLLLKDGAPIHFLPITVINLNHHQKTYPCYKCLKYPQFSFAYEWETKCQAHYYPNSQLVPKDQRAVNSQKGYLPILSQNPPYIISFKMPTMKTGVRGQNITKEFSNASESWLKIQFLRSSDIAEGMQCVARISSVAAFEVFVRRTTTCMVEYSSKHKWAARCAFINNHIREMRERGGEREETWSYSRSNFKNSSSQFSTMFAKLFRFFTGLPLKARTYASAHNIRY